MTLATETMMVHLRIELWRGQRLDRTATTVLTDTAGAAPDAAKVQKSLVPVKSLKGVTAAASALRMAVYNHTLPWRDNGDRLLPRRAYFSFMERVGELQGRFTEAVNDFLNDEYPKVVEQARFRMGELFDENDYPSAAELRKHFNAELEILPTATAGDFRVDIETAGIEKALSSANDARVDHAMGLLWQRLEDTLHDFATRMTSGERFRKELINRVNNLPIDLGDLNFAEDEALDAILYRVQSELGDLDADRLRNDPDYREKAAAVAHAILLSANPRHGE